LPSAIVYGRHDGAWRTDIGWGVVKSLVGLPCGPVGLVHTQNLRFFYKEKPTCGFGECPLRTEERTLSISGSRPALLTQTRHWRGSIQRMQTRVGISLFKLAPYVKPGYSCQPRFCQNEMVPGHFARTGSVLGHLGRAEPPPAHFDPAGPSLGDSADSGSLLVYLGRADPSVLLNGKDA